MIMRRKVVRPKPFRFKRWSSSKSDPSSYPDAIAPGQQQFIVLARARARVARTRDDDA